MYFFDEGVIARPLADNKGFHDQAADIIWYANRCGFQHIIDTNKSKRVAVFCHGMVTSIFLRTILNFDDPLSLTPDYCGITRVQAASNGVRSVRSINETHHVRDLIEW